MLFRKLARSRTSLLIFFLTIISIFSQTSLAASSNEKVVLQGRIIDSGGVAVTDSNVTFDIKIYSPSPGHCLLYEETQLVDMSNSGGTFALQIGSGTRVGSGPTLRETFTNASVASFGALTCSSGSSYTPGAIDDRTIEMTVAFAAQFLSLQAIPVKAVPYAFQANQIGGYSINNLVRLNGAGSATNLDVDQFNYLTGFFHDNGTNGTYTDDYLDAQNLVIKNVATPVLGTDAVNKNYVDTAISGVSGSLPTLNSGKIWVGNSSNAAASVSMSGDGSLDNTGKLTVTGLQGKSVTLTGLAAKDMLMYNGSQWVNTNIPTCSGSQYLTFNGSVYSCVTTSNSPIGAALNSAQIWVGNTANTAAAVSMSGDASIDNTGKLTNTGIQGKPVDPTAPTSSQVLQYNGSQWVASTLSATLPSLTDAKIWVGNGSSVATAVAPAGDVSMADTGSFSVTGIKGTAVSISGLSSNQVLQYNGSQWVNASLSATLPSLASADIWVGNGSSVATAVPASGDVSLTNAGAFTVQKIQGVAVNNTAPTSNQVLQYNGSQWIPASIVTSVAGSSLTSANFWVGNGSNLAEPVTASGDVSMDNTGAFTVQKINGTTVAGVGLANNDILQNLSGSTLAANTLLVTNGTDTGVTAVTAQNSAVLISSSTGIPSWSSSATATGQVLQYNGSTWVPTALNMSPTGQSLTAANIWVGNASNLAAPVAMSGDASISNAGSLTVTGIQTTPVSISGLSSNQVLQYNGSQWVNATLSATLPSLADTKIWVGNGSSVATAVSAGGDVSMTDTGSFTVNKIQGSTVTISSPSANQVLQYNGSAWFNVTPNYMSTTLASNNVWLGNASNVATAASMPTCAAGYYLTFNGSVFSCALDAGSTGSVTSITATSPLSASASTGNVTLSMGLADGHIYVGNSSAAAADVAMSGDTSIDDTGKVTVQKLQNSTLTISSPSANQVLQYNGSAWLNVTPSYMSTSLASANMWVGNGSGVASPVAMSGDGSLSNAGALTVTGIQTTPVAISGLSSSQVLQYNGSKWVNATLAATLPSLADAKIWIGNGSSVATAVSTSGDVSLADTGAFTVQKIQGIAVNNTAPTSNQVLQYNGSQWIPASIVTAVTGSSLNDGKFWLGNAGNTAQPVSMTGDIAMTDAGVTSYNGTVPVTKGGTGVTTYNLGQIPVYDGTKLTGLGCSAGQVLQWDASNGFICATLSGLSPVGSSLASANIWVGNASGVAAAVGMTGDVTITNAGATTVGKLGGTALNIASLSANQVLQYNGSQWVNASLSATLPSLADAKIWVGNSGTVATAVAPAGDVSMDDVGSFTVNKIQGSTVTISSPSANQVLQYNGSAWLNVTPSYMSTSLASANMWVGNGSGVAAPVAMSGDASLSNAGALTVTGIQTTPVAISGLSSSQVLQYNGSKWVNATLSTTPTGQALNSAQMWVGNASNLAAPVSMSGDGSLSNAGALTVNKIQSSTVTISSPSANQILQYNGSAWVNTALSAATLPSLADAKIWVGNSGTVATAVSASGDVSMADTGSFTVNKIQGSTVTISSPSANQVLQYNGSAWLNVTPSYMSTSLASANMWVGNGSGVAAPVAMSGDASLSNAGALTVTGIQTTPVAVASLSANQVLQYNGSKWVNATLSTTPTGQALNSAQMWVGNASNLAAPVTMSGDGSLSNAGALTVNKIQGSTVTISSPSANQVLQYNGSAWLNVTPSYQSTSLTSANIWVGNGSGVAAAVAPSGDVSMTNAGAFKVTQIQGVAVNNTTPTSNQILQYNGSQWIPATISTSPVGQSLTSGNIWVGNASNLAASVAMSGDVTISSSGATTLGKINGNAINVSSLSSGQVLQYNGSQWVNASAVSGSGTTNYVAKFSASGTIANSSITDDGTYVQSTKVFRGPASVSLSGTSVDFSAGNIQYTSASCGAITLTNMKDGATYTLAVQGTTTGTCVFTAYSDGGSTPVSVLYPPDFAATTSSYQTLFSFVVVNSTAYVTWIPGYHP